MALAAAGTGLGLAGGLATLSPPGWPAAAFGDPWGLGEFDVFTDERMKVVKYSAECVASLAPVAEGVSGGLCVPVGDSQ